MEKPGCSRSREPGGVTLAAAMRAVTPTHHEALRKNTDYVICQLQNNLRREMKAVEPGEGPGLLHWLVREDSRNRISEL